MTTETRLPYGNRHGHGEDKVCESGFWVGAVEAGEKHVQLVSAMNGNFGSMSGSISMTPGALRGLAADLIDAADFIDAHHSTETPAQ